jgi:hypothetical protein
MKKLALIILLVFSFVVYAEDKPPTFNIDYPYITNTMHSAYRTYRNGAVAMMDIENQCWNKLKKEHDLNLAATCFTYTFTGEIIELGYSQKRGSNPVPSYNVTIATKRGHDNMVNDGFSKEQLDVVGNYVGDNVGLVLMGLSNAGM